MIVSLEPSPALLIRISAPPNSCSTREANARISSGFVTSATIPNVRTPCAFFTSAAARFDVLPGPSAQGDMHPFGRQAVGHRQTDAGAAAGDDRDLALEIKLHADVPPCSEAVHPLFWTHAGASTPQASRIYFIFTRDALAGSSAEMSGYRQTYQSRCLLSISIAPVWEGLSRCRRGWCEGG